ncbi:MAG: hypothetical protein AAF641_00630 [Pseudomonadota bacterium]
MKQTVIYAGLALIIAMALAVALMNRDKGATTRQSAVLSEFIILSAAPDPRGVDFLARARIQGENRLTRLTHVQPEVVSAYASAFGMDQDALRLQIVDPDQTGPFDHTGIVFDSPDAFATGAAGPWNWALVTQRAEIRAHSDGELAACGSEITCRSWLVYWTQKDWYYAPVGEAAWLTALGNAAPKLAASLSAVGSDK